MKMDFKKIVCFGLVASFGCLSAQEELIDSNEEVAMTGGGQCPKPNDCKELMLEMECQPRRDDYDYDIYTSDRCEREEKPAPCKKSCGKERKSKKSKCGDTCNRKGAAKEAQECED